MSLTQRIQVIQRGLSEFEVEQESFLHREVFNEYSHFKRPPLYLIQGKGLVLSLRRVLVNGRRGVLKAYILHSKKPVDLPRFWIGATTPKEIREFNKEDLLNTIIGPSVSRGFEDPIEAIEFYTKIKRNATVEMQTKGFIEYIVGKGKKEVPCGKEPTLKFR
jgi:hypothetical protein